MGSKIILYATLLRVLLMSTAFFQAVLAGGTVASDVLVDKQIDDRLKERGASSGSAGVERKDTVYRPGYGTGMAVTYYFPYQDHGYRKIVYPNPHLPKRKGKGMGKGRKPAAPPQTAFPSPSGPTPIPRPTPSPTTRRPTPRPTTRRPVIPTISPAPVIPTPRPTPFPTDGPTTLFPTPEPTGRPTTPPTPRPPTRTPSSRPSSNPTISSQPTNRPTTSRPTTSARPTRTPPPTDRPTLMPTVGCRPAKGKGKGKGKGAPRKGKGYSYYYNYGGMGKRVLQTSNFQDFNGGTIDYGKLPAGGGNGEHHYNPDYWNLPICPPPTTAPTPFSKGNVGAKGKGNGRPFPSPPRGPTPPKTSLGGFYDTWTRNRNGENRG